MPDNFAEPVRLETDAGDSISGWKTVQNDIYMDVLLFIAYILFHDILDLNKLMSQLSLQDYILKNVTFDSS